MFNFHKIVREDSVNRRAKATITPNGPNGLFILTVRQMDYLFGLMLRSKGLAGLVGQRR